MATEEAEPQRHQPLWLTGYKYLTNIIFVVCSLALFLDALGIQHIVIIIVGIWFFRMAKKYRVHRGRRGYSSSMDAGFQETVKMTAASIQGTYVSDPSIKHPESGVYQVDVRETAISDSKTNNLLYGGFEKPSVLTIQVTPNNDSEGWSVQGSRKTRGNEFYVISEGFISPSGKAYWVESSNYQNILVCGDYQGNQFTGEWLSSNGDRGRYADFSPVTVVQADTAIVMGTEVSTPNDAKSSEDPLILWV